MFRFLRLVLFNTLLLCAAVAFPWSALAADYVDPVTRMEFVAIPGGHFDMGAAGLDYPPAKPLHKVTVPDFFMGKYEVTFAQYDTFCKETDREPPNDGGWGRGDRPVINVSWNDANAFADWLSQKTGKTFRLPSEAEWEYAARAGSVSRFWWGNLIGQANAHCRDCKSPFPIPGTAPVGSFSANPFGLHDVLANVREWCLDNWHYGYAGTPIDGSAWIDGSDLVVQRGGSWATYAEELVIPYRIWTYKSTQSNDVGFRLAMEK